MSRASAIIGNFPTGQDRSDYALGLDHISHARKHLGEFTIYEVIAEGRAIREQQAATDNREAARKRAIAAQEYRAAHAHDGCDGAVYFSNKATAEYNADDFQHSYDDAVAGLNRVDDCSETDTPRVKGYLLGNKALSEHHLSSGDSAVDLNQAITLLAECQTEPGYYGEASGARCETEEETLITYKTNWEMDS